MIQLAIKLRTGQLYAHNAHHAAHGSTFFEDHEFFGEAYDAIGKAYDDVVERGIALGIIEPQYLSAIQQNAIRELPEIGSDEEMLARLQYLDRGVCKEIETCMREMKLSQGTQNLLQDIADSTEKRSEYLIRRRLTE